jgi:hypothetical protein
MSSSVPLDKTVTTAGVPPEILELTGNSRGITVLFPLGRPNNPHSTKRGIDKSLGNSHIYMHKRRHLEMRKSNFKNHVRKTHITTNVCKHKLKIQKQNPTNQEATKGAVEVLYIWGISKEIHRI